MYPPLNFYCSYWSLLTAVIARSACDEAIQLVQAEKWIASLRSQ
jgi:hypothetical protein